MPLEGQSLVPLLSGSGNYQDPEILFWEHEGNRAVRKGDFKLVSKYDSRTRISSEWELYKINEDRSELNDLSGQFPEKRKELESQYEKWASRCHVIPYENLQKQRDQKAMK